MGTVVLAGGDIPLIDLGPALANAAGAKAATAKAMRDALEAIGFFAIANHGLDDAAVDRALAATRSFFGLSADEKSKVRISGAHRGYMPMRDQHRAEATQANLSESFLVGPDLAPDDPDVLAHKPLHGPNQWPARPDALRPALDAYFAEASRLGFRLLELFEIALDLPAGRFSECFTHPMAFIRALHYPPAPVPAQADLFGAAPHSDFGFLTIVTQDDAGGLQAQRRDGTWVDAPRLPGAAVVNVGDMLMRWTNDRFRSTLHRVINPKGRDRYSLAFFFDPDFETVVECLPSCTGPGNPPRYPRAVWGDYITERFDANHAYRKAAVA
ncbi:MAG: isopenicillin N synthase family oxygenase [Rhodospirillaceae bacterium]|nr:isopenicillin N synthase family oxygenase [Rhodospirillaceae bacterium]